MTPGVPISSMKKIDEKNLYEVYVDECNSRVVIMEF